MKEHISELSPDEFQKTFPIELNDVISVTPCCGIGGEASE